MEAVDRGRCIADYRFLLAVSHGQARIKGNDSMPTWISRLNEHDIIAAAMVAVALAVLLAGIALLLRAVRQGQSQETVDRAIAERQRSDSIAMGEHLPADAPAGHLSSALG